MSTQPRPAHRHPIEYVKVIRRIERASSSGLGNPTWRVFFEDGHVALTETNGSVGYAVENYTLAKYRGREVAVKAHARSGRIWDITFADGSQA